MPSTVYDEFFDSSTSSIEESLGSANKYLMDKANEDNKNIKEILSTVRSIKSGSTGSGDRLTVPGRKNLSPRVKDVGSVISPVRSSRDESMLSQAVIREIETLDENSDARHQEMMKYFRRVFGDDKTSRQGVEGPSSSSSSSMVGGVAAGVAGAAATGVKTVARAIGFAARRALPLAAAIAVTEYAEKNGIVDLDSAWNKISAGDFSGLEGPNTEKLPSVNEVTGQVNKSLSDFISPSSDRKSVIRGPQVVAGNVDAEIHNAFRAGKDVLPQYNDITTREVISEGSGRLSPPPSGTSASGPLQITKGTFEEVVKKHRDELEALGVDTSDKNNPYTQVMVAKFRHADNADKYKRSTGTDPSDKDLDLMYNLGPDGYLRAKSAPEGTTVGQLYQQIYGDRKAKNGKLLSDDTIKNNNWKSDWTMSEFLDTVDRRRNQDAHHYSMAEDGTIMRDETLKEAVKALVSGTTDNTVPRAAPLTVQGADTVDVGYPQIDSVNNVPTLNDNQNSTPEPVKQYVPSGNDSGQGQSAASIPFFLTDPGLLVTLGGMI